MPEITPVGWVAVGFTLAAYLPYIWAILTRRSEPSRASWFIWVFVTYVIVASYWTVGARNTFGVLVIYAVFATVIALL